MSCLLSAVSHLLSAICCVCCLLSAVCYLLPAVYSLLPYITSVLSTVLFLLLEVCFWDVWACYGMIVFRTSDFSIVRFGSVRFGDTRPRPEKDLQTYIHRSRCFLNFRPVFCARMISVPLLAASSARCPLLFSTLGNPLSMYPSLFYAHVSPFLSHSTP
jgi:hypothetical protein